MSVNRGMFVVDVVGRTANAQGRDLAVVEVITHELERGLFDTISFHRGAHPVPSAVRQHWTVPSAVRQHWTVQARTCSEAQSH